MPDADPWLIVARFVQIAACVLLFGQLLFTRWIARDDGLARAGVRAVLFACIAIVALSGAAWLALVASAVSGAPLPRVDSHTLWTLARATTFGQVWSLRGALLVVVAVAVAVRATRVAFAAAAACLALLAWAGHAGAGVGAQRGIELTSDVVHLVAAGAWLGALPALAWLLAHAPGAMRLHRIVRRFSAWGMTSVAALVVTGVVNGWYRVGSFAALTGSDYGRLLLAKLALVAAMLMLAAVNRYVWTPRLLGVQPHAVHALRRNTVLEIAAGLCVLGIVGALGVTMPAAHGGMRHAMPAMHMGR
jgi:putative copper resistance protein D